MSKGQAHRLRKSIYNHHKTTSSIYHDLADAPKMIQRAFLHSFTNPLDRRYAAMRLGDAVMDLALTRLDELDPMPYEHRHVGCTFDEARTSEVDGSEHDVFAPRLGFITDPEAYRQ